MRIADDETLALIRRVELAAAIYCLANGHDWSKLPDGRLLCCTCGSLWNVVNHDTQEGGGCEGVAVRPGGDTVPDIGPDRRCRRKRQTPRPLERWGPLAGVARHVAGITGGPGDRRSGERDHK